MVLDNPKFAELETAQGHPLVAEEMWTMIENKKMWTDDVEGKNSVTFALIATNNIKVSMMAFVFGITFGIGTIYVMITNGLSIGTVFGVCKMHGMAGNLLTFVAAHGVIELTCIYIAGGAGLMMGKAILFPGKYKRADKFKMQAKRAGGLFAGTIPLLLIAGCIEGFISPRTDLDPSVKYLVSFCTFIFMILYLLVPKGKKDDTSAGEVEEIPAT